MSQSLPPARLPGRSVPVPRPWRAGWYAAVTCLAVAAFYAWTVRNESISWNYGGRQTDYYNLLVDGLLAGQLHLPVDVPPELLALPDPYDPATRPAGLGLHDVSFYKGKYYIYFGVAPALTLLIPFRLLTGVALPLPAAVAVFAFAGFLASAVTWLLVRRRYFPEAGRVMTVLALLAVGTVSMAPLLVRRANVWELPLSSGYCFALAAVAGVFQSLHARTARSAAGWLAGAATGLGLAIASRPTYLFACGLLAIPLACWWWQWWRHRRRSEPAAPAPPKAATLAVLMPLAVVGAAMAWYNYARFDHPMEFGVSYMFSSVYEAKARHFSFDYMPFNIGLYFFQPASWSRYFPFVHVTAPVTKPAGFFGPEEVLGLLTNAPLLLLALAAPLALRPGGAAGRTVALGVWMLAAGTLAAGTALTLVFFYAAMARYQIDFAPALTLLACVGAHAVERATWTFHLPVAARVGVRAGVRGLMVFSIFFAVMMSVVLYGDFRRLSPKAYAHLARLFDYPAHLVEGWAGTERGPVAFEFRLSPGSPGAREPLVSTGWPGATDRVFVRHEAEGLARVGYARDGGPEEFSAPLRLADGSWHRARVEMGSLFPPEEHPFFGRMSVTQIHRLARRLLVSIDGQVLLDSYQRFHPSSPGVERIGGTKTPRDPGGRFTGEFARVQRDPDLASLANERTERCVLRLRLEGAGAGEATSQGTGRRASQPLFTVTEGAGRTVWFLTPRPGGQATFGAARSANEIWESAPVSFDASLLHEVEVSVTTRTAAVSTPAVSPGAGPAGFPQVTVRLDGVIIGTAPAVLAPDLQNILLGKNQTTFAACLAEIRGSVSRVDDARLAGDASASFGLMRFEVTFPRQPAQPREPLVVTGQTGRGDFLFVEYLDSDRVRFGLDHWGKGAIFSPALAIDRTAQHRLEVVLGSFPGNGSVAAGLSAAVKVRLDDQDVWSATARFYPAESEDVFVGRNPIGGTSCASLFSGDIQNVIRLPGAGSTAPQTQRLPGPR